MFNLNGGLVGWLVGWRCWLVQVDWFKLVGWLVFTVGGLVLFW